MSTTTDSISSLDTLIRSQVRRWAVAQPADDYRAAIADTTDANAMWRALADMADQQVRADQWIRVDMVMDAGRSPHEALTAVVKSNLDTILRGADDTWSGRGNDLRRVQHDALCQWTEAARDLLLANGLGA